MMRRVWSAVAVVMVGLLSGSLASVPGTPAALGPSVIRVQGVKALYGIGALGAEDVWAVGETDDGPAKGAVAHWDGVQWSKVATIDVGSGSHTLRGVDARAKDDVWAVGWYENDAYTTKTLVARWDGKEWKVVLSPGTGELVAVAALSADDVWAVGVAGKQSLILHWDGEEWKQVPGPETTRQYTYKLNSIAAVSAQDVWAAGEHGTMVHWDGKKWSEVEVKMGQDRRVYRIQFTGVVALAANDVWATGYIHTIGGYDHSLLYILRWDGVNWNDVVTVGDMSVYPCGPIGYCSFLGISARSEKDIWVVGSGRALQERGALVTHWDGKDWTFDPCPVRIEGLRGVAATSSGEVWAIPGGAEVVDLRHGPCPTATPTLPPPPTWTPMPTITVPTMPPPVQTIYGAVQTVPIAVPSVGQP